MASPAPPCGPDASPAMESQASLPDHLTEDILLHLTTAADLARASMAGPSLRRIVTDHSFLRRFRVLHPPPLLGILSDPFIPAQPPHPSAAAARTLAGTDFSCSFLPSRDRPWIRRDCRDGRALLCVASDGRALVKDVAVCDPLHRRYLLLPPVPQDLSDLVYHCQPFLAPAGGDEVPADAPLRFRVMCLAKYQTQLVLFVLSSSGGCAGPWHAIPFDGWSALVAQVSEGEDVRSSTAFGNRYYAHGCFCWAIPGIGKLLMLDIATMEFSSIDLPPSPWSNSQMAFVEAREGRLGMFTLNFNPENYAYYLWYTILRSNGEGTRQWEMENRLTLPDDDYHFKILGVAGGYLLLQAFTKQMWWIPSFQRPKFDSYCFSLDLQTMKLDRFCGVDAILSSVDLYAGFPPSLSPPTI